MRCKNCGWENRDGIDTCEKCHSKLDVMLVHDETTCVSERMRGTVSEEVVFNPDSGPGGNILNTTCPKCGYPLSPSSKVCPNCNTPIEAAPVPTQMLLCRHCGAELSAEAKFCSACGAPISQVVSRIQRSGLGTVMGGPSAGMQGTNTFCTLRPIAWEGEEVNYNPVTYTGQNIVLSRSNTDANNNTITSREQAVLIHEDGEWFIENRSDMKTTYVRVNGRTKLSSGDIIVLGNREFEFKG